MQFTNNVVQDNRGTFPLLRIEYAGAGGEINFTGNVIANNTDPESADDYSDNSDYDYYGNNNDDTRAVVQLVNFRHPAQVYVSDNQFNNPDSRHELSVELRIPFTSVVDLGLNYWNRNKYSAVIQRYVIGLRNYVCLTMTVIVEYGVLIDKQFLFSFLPH